MTFRTIVLAGFACALAAPAWAGSGFYVGAGLGSQSPMSSDWKVPSLNQFGKYSLKRSNTFIADAGYKFSSGLRIEVESQFGQYDGHDITNDPLNLVSDLHGHISQSTVYLNADYDFPIFSSLGGTIGAGIGSAWSNTKGSAFSGLAVVHGDDRAFAWQIGGGITHRLLPNLDLQLDYRYQGAGSTTITENGVGDFHLGGIKAQTVTLSARLYLLP
ncbi:MAG TPA: outer membrane beta-barrel protein [Rhizomicrobium sp.]|jgi:opacity protein-like surface antigen